MVYLYGICGSIYRPLDDDLVEDGILLFTDADLAERYIAKINGEEFVAKGIPDSYVLRDLLEHMEQKGVCYVKIDEFHRDGITNILLRNLLDE